MNGFREANFSYNPENNLATYVEKMITKVVSNQEKETLKAIERYCEENGYIPNIIEKEKLELVLKIGINELAKREMNGNFDNNKK